MKGFTVITRLCLHQHFKLSRTKKPLANASGFILLVNSNIKLSSTFKEITRILAGKYFCLLTRFIISFI